MEKSIKKYYLIILVFFIFSLILPTSYAFAYNDSLSIIGVLPIKVGYFPFEGYHNNENNAKSGYGYDYLMELSIYTGWKYEYIDASFNDCIDMLEKGEIDLIGSLQKTAKREETLDFAQLSSGISTAQLFTRKDNVEIAFEDFQAFNGKKVGVMNGNSRNVQFEKYEEENGFECEQVSFINENDLISAVESGNVDFGLLSNLRAMISFRIVASFNPSPFYFATTKGNSEVLNRLNEGMSKIKTYNPAFDNTLNDKYYVDKNSTPVYSRQEVNYIENSADLRVMYDPAWIPIEYKNPKTSEYTGLMSEIFDRLVERTTLSNGTKLKFQFDTANTYEEALVRFKDEKFDIFGAVCINSNLAYELGSGLSTEVFKSNIMQVSNYSAKNEVVVLPKAKGTNVQIETYLQNKYEIVYLNNITECFDAVARGKAKSTFTNMVAAEYFLSIPMYSKLERIGVGNISDKVCIAVAHNEKNNDILLSIINKAIKSLPAYEINNLVSMHSQSNLGISISDLYFDNPLAFILAIIVFIAIIILFLLSIFIIKKDFSLKIYSNSIIDPLTKICNRDEYFRRVKEMLVKSGDTRYMMCNIDINKFKLINEFYGNDEGDKVLKYIAGKLNDRFKNRTEICYGRIDRDVFSWIMPYSLDVIDKIRNQTETAFNDYSLPFRLTYSMGIYIIDEKAMPIRSMCDRAELALRETKKRAINSFGFYDEKIVKNLEYESFVESNMENAITNGEFVIYYQPKVEIYNKSIIGAEALIRWSHPEKGMISPGQFIPIFEKNGFIIKLDFYVWEQVCIYLKNRINKGKCILPISVNVSRLHLFDPNFCDKIIQLVNKYEIESKYLELEITESVYAEDYEMLKKSITILREYGFKILMDDFGSGYSSLNMLKDYSIDILKIDLKFLVNMDDNDIKGKWIISSIVDMAQKLGLEVIAEGVETLAQTEFLKTVGCNFAQGFYFARPMPESEFTEKLDIKV